MPACKHALRCDFVPNLPVTHPAPVRPEEHERDGLIHVQRSASPHINGVKVRKRALVADFVENQLQFGLHLKK